MAGVAPMTLTALPEGPPSTTTDPDVPLELGRTDTGGDRVFRFVLGVAAAIVLAILVSVVVFLSVDGWHAFRVAGVRLFTGTTWAPDLGKFDIWPLLLGTGAIAIVSLIIAMPVSIACALLINEYLPPRLRPFLTGVIDVLATVPSIIYGFWGLEVVSHLQAPTAKWIVDNLSFVPFFRTPTPGQYVNSIFACSLVCAVTIIPIITSVSRDVMSQTPRDVCEAAVGLGGTRWGMITDVIFPFSRNGIVSAGLLGLGRGLGETMIVVLILSSANKTTAALFGPQGLGSIAKEITEQFPTETHLGQSALVLAGLVLFFTTLVVNIVSRIIIGKSRVGASRSSGPAPTVLTSPPIEGPPDPHVPTAGGGEPVDRPIRRARVQSEQLVEFFGSLLASFALVWLGFRIAGISGAVGFGLLWCALFFVLYAIVSWRNHGVLAMKDRLATTAVWIGGAIALVPLVAVISYVFIQGASVAMADFPHFWTSDMAALSATAPVTAVGAGAAIVGTLEQIAIATVLTVPLGILTATYLADTNNIFSRTVAAVVDAMTGAPAIILGLFIYLFWVAPRGTSGKSGWAAGMALAVMMLPVVTRAALEVVQIVPGSLREAALALGAPQWRVLVRIVLPTARVGLMTAVILGVARIAGETAPILFNAGGNFNFNWNPFSGQQDNLPFRIYQLIFQPGPNVIRMAWGVSFVLIVLVLLLFIIARLIGSSKPGKRRLPRLFRLRRST